MAAKTTDNLLEICPLCNESITIYAIGSCDHPVCFKCSTRMRVLCEQMYCAICRTDLSKVIFCKKRHKFDSIGTHSYPFFRRAKIFFETEEIQSEFFRLQDHACPICKELRPLKSFLMLRNHMRKEHNLFYCDLCVKNLKVFTYMRKTYNRKNLGEHRRVGDLDDHTQSHVGHPLCKFCDERYLDNDELVRHLRIDHFYCHFCDSDGISNLFFGGYDDLREHFRDSHYLCEEGDCLYEKFTSAFRSDIDLKAHTSQMHGRGMSKATARQARVIDVDFQFSDSNRRGHAGPRDRDRDGPQEQRQGYSRGRGRPDRHDRHDRRKEREEEESAKAIAAVLTDIQRQGHVNVVDKALIQGSLGPVPEAVKAATLAFEERTTDFPSLDGRISHMDRSSDDEDRSREESRQTPDNLAKKLARANKFSVQDGDMEDQDFPSLGGPGAAAQPFHPRPTQAWEFRAAASDFPTLGSGKKKSAQPPAQSGTWVVSKPQSRSTSGVSPITQKSLSDFPSLSSIGGSLFKPLPARVKTSVPKPQSRTVQPQVQPRSSQPQRHTAPQSHNREWTDDHDEDDKTKVMFQNSVQEHQSKIKTIKSVPDSNSRPVAQNSQKNLKEADFPTLGKKFPSKKQSPSSTPATTWGPKKTDPSNEPVPEEKSEAGQFLKMKTKIKKKKVPTATLR